MKIAIGADHAGFSLKEKLKKYLRQKNIDVNDFGTYSEASTDYPDFAHPVAFAVERKEADFGLLMCGSGNGIAMTANKHAGIRAALCWKEELARLARAHNNANILSLPARFIEEEEAKKCVDAFLSTAFEGERHEGRVRKING
jgi:ribose 5-phosphate isomerase B